VIAFVGSQIPLTFHTVINYLNSVNVPLVGGDTEDAGWYTNPMAFPQGGSIPLQAAGSLKMISADGHKKAAVYACIESSLCSQFVNLMKQEAPSYGVDVVTSGGVSLTQPSYTAQCLSAAGAKATALFVALDPSGLQRLTDDCQATGYSPAYYTISIGVTEADLTNRALNHMKWANMGFAYSDATDPAVAAYRQAMQAYASAGASVGGPSASAWASGQLVRAAASRLSPTPTAQDIINGLWALKDATLGGLVPPLTFPRGKPPIVAQCFWQMEILNGAFASPTAGASTCL
jgi:branched-chain amino acid transport system substrate-binding protein